MQHHLRMRGCHLRSEEEEVKKGLNLYTRQPKVDEAGSRCFCRRLAYVNRTARAEQDRRYRVIVETSRQRAEEEGQPDAQVGQSGEECQADCKEVNPSKRRKVDEGKGRVGGEATATKEKKKKKRRERTEAKAGKKKSNATLGADVSWIKKEKVDADYGAATQLNRGLSSGGDDTADTRRSDDEETQSDTEMEYVRNHDNNSFDFDKFHSEDGSAIGKDSRSGHEMSEKKGGNNQVREGDKQTRGEDNRKRADASKLDESSVTTIKQEPELSDDSSDVEEGNKLYGHVKKLELFNG